MKYRIGTHQFASQVRIREFVRSALLQYDVGEVVNEEDFEFLVALLARHPEHEEKEGVGISHFVRGEHPKFRSPCFVLHRLDGSSTDFSTETCLKGKGPSLIEEFREACRHAVDSRVLSQKNKIHDGGLVRCPETGEALTKGQYQIVQSDPSWSVLVGQFIESFSVVLNPELLTRPADNQYSAELADEKLAKQFREFHADRMNLKIKRVRSSQSGG